MSESQIDARFYGECHPLVTNNSAVNRACNRRITVYLSCEAVIEPVTKASEAEGKPAPPVAEPAAPKPLTVSLQGEPTAQVAQTIGPVVFASKAVALL